MLEDYSVGWKVSFPLKSSIMNYATLFRTESAAKDYLENLVNSVNLVSRPRPGPSPARARVPGPAVKGGMGWRLAVRNILNI